MRDGLRTVLVKPKWRQLLPWLLVVAAANGCAAFQLGAKLPPYIQPDLASRHALLDLRAVPSPAIFVHGRYFAVGEPLQVRVAADETVLVEAEYRSPRGQCRPVVTFVPVEGETYSLWHVLEGDNCSFKVTRQDGSELKDFLARPEPKLRPPRLIEKKRASTSSRD